MSPVRVTSFLVLLFLLSHTGNALAWDGERQGFLLGIGMGPGYQVWSIHEEDQFWAFAYDFKIGWAMSNTRLFYFAEGLCFGSDTLLVNASLGFNLFKQDSSPSPFLVAEVGFYGGPAREEGDEEPTEPPAFEENGDEDIFTLGVTLGIGLEFCSHLSIQFDITAAPIQDFFPATLRLKVNALGY